MHYLHTTVVTADLDESVAFYADNLSMTVFRKFDVADLGLKAAFLAAPNDEASARSERFSPALALVQKLNEPDADTGISHVCFRVPDIYAICEKVAAAGYRFKVPPRDGFRALVHTPEGAVIEFHQAGERRTPMEPWISMPDDAADTKKSV